MVSMAAAWAAPSLAAGTIRQKQEWLVEVNTTGYNGYMMLMVRDDQSEKERSGWEDSLVGAAAAMTMKREMMAVVDFIFASSLWP